jgi:predicted ATPase
LYILKNHFPEIFERIISYYKETFSFLTDVDIIDWGALHKGYGNVGQIPVFCVREKGVKNWIELGEISSGMQKVLLILTDLFSLSKGSVYLIDEYENSLGVGAINFFPTIMFDRENEVQLIITSHHPYLISNIPIKNWFVFHRRGSHVMIKFGEELEQRYGNSKQEAFIKLLNDPFYSEGIE